MTFPGFLVVLALACVATALHAIWVDASVQTTIIRVIAVSVGLQVVYFLYILLSSRDEKNRRPDNGRPSGEGD